MHSACLCNRSLTIVRSVYWLMRDTKHFLDMLQERGIRPEWVEDTIAGPDLLEDQPDGTQHYLKRVADHGGRWLRVVVDTRQQPPARITVFFDRRLQDTQP